MISQRMLAKIGQTGIPVVNVANACATGATAFRDAWMTIKAVVQIGVEHARNHGTTFKQFAKVSVKNHHHSTMNPKSMYRVETPLEEDMGAEIISCPNTKLMCSINVDSSAAAVLASEATTKRLGLMDRAVKVRASEMSSNPFAARQLAMPDFSPLPAWAPKTPMNKPASAPGI